MFIITFNAVGLMTAPFIVATTVAEHEMPKNSCTSSCLIILGDELFPGATADPQNKSQGFVAFVQTEKRSVSNSKNE